MSPQSQSVTQLLAEWRAGNPQTREQLMPIVYGQLRALAGRLIASERPGHTLAATALVHEAYLKLVDVDVPWQDRAHFFTLAARMMRRILVDYAKTQRRQKRGGGAEKISLEDMAVVPAPPDSCLPEVDEALERLLALDPRKAELIDLLYFGGLTHPQAPHTRAISTAARQRALRRATHSRHHELSGAG